MPLSSTSKAILRKLSDRDLSAQEVAAVVARALARRQEYAGHQGGPYGSGYRQATDAILCDLQDILDGRVPGEE